MGDRGGVFISYRRDDSRGSAGRLYDGIAERIGRASVFRDLDALAPGAEYGKDILAAIGQCSAFIAVIGPKWLEARDATGQRRIDRTDDLVRIEIATALAQRKVVIPVLVDDGDMPPPEQLPPDLAPLASRNALSISDQRWEYDLGRLMAVLDGAAGRGPAANADPSPPPAVPDRRGRSVERRLAKVILALVVVGVFAASALRDGPSPNDDITAPEPTVTTPPSSVRSEST
ncbi:MAG: toll/interleukin-1 receptor domain-containing protein, partial [Acidimicrobiales bacterium]